MPLNSPPAQRHDGSREAGTQLDAWILGPELGRGATAIVYRARHATTGEVGAAKVVHATLAFNNEVISRFLREAEIAERFSCCPRVLGRGTSSEGLPFFVQELIEGGTLSERLAKGPLTLVQSLAIGEATARALEMLHGAGVFHRDVKPSNIAVGSDGRIVLLDLGIAKVAGTLRETRDGMVLGTPAYAAPEQLVAPAQVDARADVFALAATLFFALSGSRLREGPLETVLAEAIHERPRRLRDVASHLPAAVTATIDKALSYARSERFDSMASFAAALRACHVEAIEASGAGSRASNTLVGLGFVEAATVAPRAGLVAQSPVEVSMPRVADSFAPPSRTPSYRPPSLGSRRSAPVAEPAPRESCATQGSHEAPFRRAVRPEVLAVLFLAFFITLVLGTFAAWGSG